MWTSFLDPHQYHEGRGAGSARVFPLDVEVALGGTPDLFRSLR